MTDPMGTLDMLDLLAEEDRGAKRQEQEARAPRAPMEVERDLILDAITNRHTIDRRPGERATVVEAILLEARSHRGHVDPNRVRDRLQLDTTGRPGEGRVHSSVVGAVYGKLVRGGLLEPGEWIPSTNRAKGAGGKLVRAYHLTLTTTEQENHS